MRDQDKYASRIQADTKVHVKTYTLHELAKIYEHVVPAVNAEYDNQGLVKATGAGWYGDISTQADAIARMAEGWKPGADRVKTLADGLNINIEAPVSRRRRPVWADEGDSLDADRALAGQWDNAWRTTRPALTSGPQIVDVVFTWGGNCTVSAEEMFWNGAAAIVVTDLLEQSGYGVRVIASSNALQGDDRGTPATINVIVKESDEPLQPDALASLACHAGIFRTYGFRAILNSPFAVGDGLGSQRPLEYMAPALLTQGDLEAGAVLLKNANNRQSAVESIKAALASVNGGK